jgi:hypothetical protein
MNEDMFMEKKEQ